MSIATVVTYAKRDAPGPDTSKTLLRNELSQFDAVEPISAIAGFGKPESREGDCCCI